MSNLNEFLSFIHSKGLSKNDFTIEEKNNCSIVSFDEMEDNQIYKILLIISHEKNDIEIYIKKKIKDCSLIGVLTYLNNLNKIYTQMNFFYDDEFAILKTYCKAYSNIEQAIEQMVNGLSVAILEFKSL